MELRVYTIDGSETARTATLNDKIFNVEPNDHAIWLDVKQFREPAQAQRHMHHG